MNTSQYPINTNWLETRGFRPEVQGLRALALFLVVTYHIWFGRVSGGVDVFLFISAFLLSLSTIRKINEGKPLAPIKYWLHVFQRLLPAAATVVAGTVVASFFFLAPSRLLSIVQDAIAALLYFLNWRLAFNATDYYAQDAATKTPLQHFWSLSMQGQIFILWPLLFIVIALLVRKFRMPILPTAFLLFGVIWAVSLAFSVHETYSPAQGFAYFDTRARLWEFATGTLLAIITFRWKAPMWMRVPMGWVGIVGLISCGFVLPVQQAFPGYLALWPIMSGALIILAGRTNSPYGADRILASRPMLKLGEISYALYLVHWPVFVIYSTRTHQEHPGFFMGTVLILSSIVIAWLIHNFIEQPLRKLGGSPQKRVSEEPAKKANPYFVPLAVITACVTVVGAPLAYAQHKLEVRNTQLVAFADQAGSDDFPGALALGRPETRYRHQPIPAADPLSQYDELAQGTCSGQFAVHHSELAGNCGQLLKGEVDSPVVMLIGASHVGQSVALYRQLAEERQFNLIDLHKGSCRYPLENSSNPNESCKVYNNLIDDEVLQRLPDTVGLMVTQTDANSNQEVIVPGIEEKINLFTSHGIKVIGLRDNPRWVENMYECAQMSPENPKLCSAPFDEKMAQNNPAQSLIDKNSLVYGLDFTQQYCPNGECLPIVGNVVVYMDDNHISKAYKKTLYSEMSRQLEEQGWKP